MNVEGGCISSARILSADGASMLALEERGGLAMIKLECLEGILI